MILQIKKKTLDLSKRTHIMGILNVTPDSFSDGGQYDVLDLAVKQALQMEKDGADIIDIGGESTRPGYTPISAEEEIKRVVPVIKAVTEQVNLPVSIDTYKAETARQAIDAGATIINDIWGGKRDPEMNQVAADKHVPIILMHNRTDMNYTSLIADMKRDLQESIDLALAAGVPKEHIILDPGVGFAKTSEHNLIVMNHLEEFHTLGYPILLGTSRKGFIGEILQNQAKERDNGTGATTCLGIAKGAQIIRVHNVTVTREFVKMMDAMLQAGGGCNG